MIAAMSSLATNTINPQDEKSYMEELSDDDSWWSDSNQRRIFVGGMLIF